MKVKEESEKVGLKCNIQKTKIMASGSITSWQIDGETVWDIIFLGSKITADGDCSHKIKQCLLLGRKVMTNLDSILKSRDITLPTKVHLVKAMVFPVVMYGCESWIVKKAECRKIDAFELWCWRRLLRVPWTASRFNQSILKGISPGFWLEGLMLKLKLQYFGHLMRRVDSLQKTLMLGGIAGGGEGDGRGWDGWMASPTRWTWVWVNSRSWWWTGRPGVLRFIGCKESDTTEWVNWTELLEKNLKSPLNCKEIKPVNPKENQSWIFIGRTDAEANAPILRLPHENWLIGQDTAAQKDWKQEQKRMTEDEMIGLHHQLNGMNLSKLWDLVLDKEAWCAEVHDITNCRTWLSDWTDSNVVGCEINRQKSIAFFI